MTFELRKKGCHVFSFLLSSFGSLNVCEHICRLFDCFYENVRSLSSFSLDVEERSFVVYKQRKDMYLSFNFFFVFEEERLKHVFSCFLLKRFRALQLSLFSLNKKQQPG